MAAKVFWKSGAYEELVKRVQYLPHILAFPDADDVAIDEELPEIEGFPEHTYPELEYLS